MVEAQRPDGALRDHRRHRAGARDDGRLRGDGVFRDEPHGRDRRAHRARRFEPQVARTSIGRTARLGAIGAAAGLLGSFALSRLAASLLYETSPADPAVYAGAVAVIPVALLAASGLPVRRALRIDPVEVLRTE